MPPDETATQSAGQSPLQEPAFQDAVRTQLLDMFVRPELERRATPDIEVTQFAAILSPGGAVKVLINEEVTWVAQAVAKRPIEAGEQLTTDDFDATTMRAIRPEAAGADDAWAGMSDGPAARFLTFNFQRNRGRARKLLEVATEYRTTAITALNSGFLRPATENLFAAAELAVKAEMFLIDDNPTTRHDAREAYFSEWARLGNSPQSHADTLQALRAARPAARYGDEGPDVEAGALRRYAAEVDDMIEFARQRASHPLD